MDDDIFTLARDRGAVAAVRTLLFMAMIFLWLSVVSQLLYSVKSVSCYINPEYSNPANFDQVMDIFATQSLSSSKCVFYLEQRISDSPTNTSCTDLLRVSLTPSSATLHQNTIGSARRYSTTASTTSSTRSLTAPSLLPASSSPLSPRPTRPIRRQTTPEPAPPHAVATEALPPQVVTPIPA